MTAPNVGAAEGYDLLTLFFKKPNQKIAACGSSYRGYRFQGYGLPPEPLSTLPPCS